jgi:hypothetical protein
MRLLTIVERAAKRGFRVMDAAPLRFVSHLAARECVGFYGELYKFILTSQNSYLMVEEIAL